MTGQVFGERFAVIPEELLYSDLSDRGIRLWATLHRYAGQDGRAFPGRKKLAERLHCSLSTLDGALRELEASGWMHTEAEYREDGGRKSSNYHLHRPPHTGTPVTPPTDQPVGVDRPAGHQEGEPDNENQKEEKPSAPEGAEPKQDRHRDPAWDALVAAVGWAPQTKAEKARVGKAVREIVTALPQETSRDDVGKHIEARARRYREHWPNAELTPEALVKHWSKFGPQSPARPAARPAPAPERGTLTEAEHLRRRDPADRTWAEFLKSLEGLTDAEREVERSSRRDGLRERIFMETGDNPTRETGWFYEEGETGWQKVQGQHAQGSEQEPGVSQ